MLYREDILTVGKSIGYFLTEAEVDEVLSRYPVEQDNDLTATWNLVVENIIYNVVAER